MKHAFFLSLFILSGASLLSCQSGGDAGSPAAADFISFTIDDKNLSFTAGYSVSGSYTAAAPFGMYAYEDASDTRTLIGAGDAATGGKYYIAVSFYGKDTGECPTDSIHIATPQGYFDQTFKSKMSTTVTEYGEVGEKIKGSFSGTLPLFNADGSSTDTVCGVEGTFCVTRKADTSF